MFGRRDRRSTTSAQANTGCQNCYAPKDFLETTTSGSIICKICGVTSTVILTATQNEWYDEGGVFANKSISQIGSSQRLMAQKKRKQQQPLPSSSSGEQDDHQSEGYSEFAFSTDGEGGGKLFQPKQRKTIDSAISASDEDVEATKRRPQHKPGDVFLGFQIILSEQALRLGEEYQNPILSQHVREIWLSYIRFFEGYYNKVNKDKKQHDWLTKHLSDLSASSGGNSEVPGVVVRNTGLNRYRFKTNDAAAVEISLSNIVNHTTLLSILWLGCLKSCQAVLPGDILHLIGCGIIPFYSSHTLLPASLDAKSTFYFQGNQGSQASLFSPKHLPNILDIERNASRIAELLNIEHNLFNPIMFDEEYFNRVFNRLSLSGDKLSKIANSIWKKLFNGEKYARMRKIFLKEPREYYKHDTFSYLNTDDARRLPRRFDRLGSRREDSILSQVVFFDKPLFIYLGAIVVVVCKMFNFTIPHRDLWLFENDNLLLDNIDANLIFDPRTSIMHECVKEIDSLLDMIPSDESMDEEKSTKIEEEKSSIIKKGTTPDGKIINSYPIFKFHPSSKRARIPIYNILTIYPPYYVDLISNVAHSIFGIELLNYNLQSSFEFIQADSEHIPVNERYLYVLHEAVCLLEKFLFGKEIKEDTFARRTKSKQRM